MNISLTVTIDLEKQTGKFVSRADLVSALIDELDNANPGSIQVEDSEYDVTAWDVSETAAQRPGAP